MPEIVPRAAWGANPLVTPAPSIPTPTQYLWLHHTASTSLHGASGMRSIQQGALNGGYSDIEYTYMVDTDGVIYECRGPGRNTAAQNAKGGPDNNAVSHAICAMGNFETQQPTDALIDSTAWLVRHMYANRWIDRPVIDGPHRDAPGCSTACCGLHLIAMIPTINSLAEGAPKPSTGGAVELSRSKSGNGYYIVGDDGGVFAYGDARFYGSIPGLKPPPKLAAPIVGMAQRPQGDGYLLVGADGGVFAFGAAKMVGGMAGKKLDAPIVDIEYDAQGDGYWLMGADGGIFTFGNAKFYGSAAGKV